MASIPIGPVGKDKGEESIVDTLASNPKLLFAELTRYRAIAAFLQAVSTWNGIAQVAAEKDGTVPPPPIPPTDYALPADQPDPPDPVPTEALVTVGKAVERRKDEPVRYIALGPIADAGIAETLEALAEDGTHVKLVQVETKYGKTQWWEPVEENAIQRNA